MIETKVPQDIRSYKTKIVGPFTARQLIVVVFIVALNILLVSLLYQYIAIDIFIYILLILDLLLSVFAFDFQGIPLSKYIMQVGYRVFLFPTKRKQKSRSNRTPDNIQELKKTKEKNKNNIAKLSKTHPEYIPYK